jgi:uncharacterized protein YegP (UPF0339 family)
MVAHNGQILFRSESYTTKAKAKKGTESVRVNGVEPSRYTVKESADGKFYFTLKAANGETIATSGMYARKYNANRGVETAVKLVGEAQRVRAAYEGGARFLTFRGNDSRYYFHVRASNGEIVLQSQGYSGSSGMANAIASVRENAKIASRFELVEGADGEYFFRLNAANGETIAYGEGYSTKGNAQRAIDGLVTLFKSELVADPKALPQPAARRIEQYPALQTGLDILGDLAAQGEQVAYFGYAEQTTRSSGSTCVSVDAEQAAQELDSAMQFVIQGGGDASQFSQEQQVAMQQDLRDYLGQDSYKVCSDESDGFLTQGQTTFVLSTQQDGPQMVYELGWDE